MSAWELYLITRLDTINGVFAAAGGFLLVACCIVSAVMASDGDKKEEIWKLVRPFFMSSIIMFVLVMALPKTTDYLIIRGVSTVTQNDRVTDNVAKIINGVEAYIDKTLGQVNR